VRPAVVGKLRRKRCQTPRKVARIACRPWSAYRGKAKGGAIVVSGSHFSELGVLNAKGLYRHPGIWTSAARDHARPRFLAWPSEFT